MKTKNLLKKAFLLLALMGGASSAWGDVTTIFDANDEGWSADGVNLTTGTTTVGSATWHGGSSVAIDGGKTVGGVVWNKRIKYGGGSTFQSGNSFARVLAVTVPSAGTLKVYFLSGSKGKTRSVYVSSAPSSTNRDKTTAIISASDDGNDGNVAIGTVSAGTYYVWCEENIGVMGVTFEASAPASAPTITTQPASAVYLLNETPAALAVEASASSGELSYQWYSNTTGIADPENDTAIDGATSSTLAAAKISTASAGTTCYYVVVTDANGSTTSDVASIEVVNGIAPEVSATISAPAVRVGTNVTLTASIDAGVPVPTLQWYSCDSDGSNEVAVEGQTNTTYVFAPDAVGTYYYKVKASNASGNDYSDVLSLTVIAQGVSGTVSDLETITSNYTFIADNHTASGTIGFTAGYLYDDSRIYSQLGNSVATNKGSSTIDGNTYYNSLRVKSDSQDLLAFKVGGACVITFYTENPLKTPARIIKVGNSANDDSYGNISDANEAHVITIPAAGTVYLTGTGDRFIAGFKVVFNVSKTITSAGWATYCSPYALDFTGDIANLTNAYIVTGATGSTLNLTSVKGSKVAANTGILIEGSEGTVTIPVAASGTDYSSTNKLVGVTSDTPIAAEVGYVLMADPSLGFYKNANAFTVGANTAYLPADFAAGAARSAFFFGGNITAVDNVEAAAEAKAKDGKFIENGKLVIVKNGVKYNAAGAQVK